MIEKISDDIIRLKQRRGEQLHPEDYCLLKINEIIDHLPQEKEDVCMSCINYCKGERVLDTCPNYLAKQPTKEPQEKECNDINEKDGLYPNAYDAMANKINCKIDSHIPKEDGLTCECGYFCKQPTKEVPVQGDKELWDLIANYFPAFEGGIGAENKRTLFEKISKLIDKRIQAISALYRKDVK